MRLYFLFFLFTISSFCSFGQTTKGKVAKPEIDTTSFCSVLGGFMAEARTDFAGIKGNVTNSNGNTVIYSTKRGLPGAITSAVVANDGVFRYEAVVYQGTAKENMQEVYAFHIYVLAGCLENNGYVRTTSPNAEKEVEKYPLIKFAKPNSNAPWCTLGIDYSDIGSIYTVTISLNK